MGAILIIHRPGADLGPAYEAANGASLITIAAADGAAVLEALDQAEAHSAVIVTPPAETRKGDAYQAAALALTQSGFPVIEMTPGFDAPFDPDDETHPGPIGATAFVGGFGPDGYAIAIDLIRERLA